MYPVIRLRYIENTIRILYPEINPEYSSGYTQDYCILIKIWDTNQDKVRILYPHKNPEYQPGYGQDTQDTLRIYSILPMKNTPNTLGYAQNTIS